MSRNRSLLSAVLRWWNTLEASQTRQRGLPPRLLPYIPVGGSVLDVGSGNGALASQFGQPGRAQTVCGVDVLIQPETRIPVTRFDGETLPFADASFDVVTLIDVLHHTDHPERLLQEAVRVARQQVVIKDHYWETRFDRWLLTVSDYLGNAAYGIYLPYRFLRMEQWAALFGDLGLTPVVTQQFHYAALDRTRQVIFVVKTGSGGA